jgi:lambda family phage portal protein
MSRRRGAITDAHTIIQAFNYLRSDYNAANTSRFRRTRSGVSSTPTNFDYHIRNESGFFRMMEFARDIERNDVVVGQGITRLVDNVIQDGFPLDPMTGDEDLNGYIRERWTNWAEQPDNCHRAGEYDWHDIERLALRQVVVDGDVVILPRKDQTLELVEAHRLRTPRTKRNVVLGVLLSEARKRLEYWIAADNIDPLRASLKVSDITRWPVRDSNGNRIVHHLYFPKRLSQTRGVTTLAPIADTTGMHDDIQFAKLVQQQVVSCFATLRERSPDFSGTGLKQYGEKEEETLGDGSTRVIEGVGPGMEIEGAPGETLKGFAPNVPNPEFFEHATLILTFISINLNLPLAVLLLDPRQTNFSAWRGAIDQARIGFKRIQCWLVRKMHRPIYEWKIRQWIRIDPEIRKAANNPDIKIFRHRWNPPEWQYIEPLKDASAELLRSRNALISHRRLHAERGRDWDEVSTEIVEDNVKAIRKAVLAKQDLAGEFPDEVFHWREFLSLPTPDGISVSIGSESDSEKQEVTNGT